MQKISKPGFKLNKYAIYIIPTVILLVSVFFSFKIFAEQSGTSPESGMTSRIKSTYDSLVTLGNGAETAGSWGNWGPVWNRIRSSSEWVPTSDATSNDVSLGKTFYSGASRTVKTGTMSNIDYEKQSLVILDDRAGIDYGETGSWTKTNASPEVWKDETTGLYWSGVQGGTTDNRNDHDCPFYNFAKRGDYDGSEGWCGNAINICGTLSLDANGNGTPDVKWYLPSAKELAQASIDSIYKKTNPGWVTQNSFWSSSRDAGTANYAYYVYLATIEIRYTYNYTSNSNYVRCVLRDL